MIDERIRRAAAAEACWKRFYGKAYDPGKRDCVKLATHALIKMGHGSGPVKGLKYNTEAQGYRLLLKAGFKTLTDGLDSMGLPRIAPAMARQGDIIALEAAVENPSGHALAVVMSDGVILGFSGGICSTWRPISYQVDMNGQPLAWRL
nr:MAG TPA: hypothetical protein [Caudoviricetes sp.]